MEPARCAAVGICCGGAAQPAARTVTPKKEFVDRVVSLHIQRCRRRLSQLSGHMDVFSGRWRPWEAIATPVYTSRLSTEG